MAPREPAGDEGLARLRRAVAAWGLEMRTLLFILVLPFAIAWAALAMILRLIIWFTVFGAVVDWLDDDCRGH